MKKAWVVGVLGAAAAVLILVISDQLASPEAGKCDAVPGALAKFQPADDPAPVPDEPFILGSDELRTLQSYAGQGLVVNFWATWCAPCIKEMPELLRLKSRLADAGIQVLAISQDRKGADIVGKFLEINKLDGLGVLIDKRGRLGRKLGIKGLPTTFLIDPQGREVGRVLGVEKWDDAAVVAALRDCLAPAGAGG
ncbi:MAG: TlpA family protein disulfide reductase [Hyphomicrobiales bacterium]|nr:TlpA family protein disulfide reductase [Hyphomicrobiales bacterium]MCP5371043.1 TlpA family protein disulfide reductase [Hyphomicrobiales bacterium]